MPVLIVYGMPPSVEKELQILINRLQADIGAVLDIDPDEVSVFFPADIVSVGLGEELICLAEGILRFEDPDHSQEVRKRIAVDAMHSLRIFAQTHLPQCRGVSVMVKRFAYEDGLASCDIR